MLSEILFATAAVAASVFIYTRRQIYARKYVTSIDPVAVMDFALKVRSNDVYVNLEFTGNANTCIEVITYNKFASYVEKNIDKLNNYIYMPRSSGRSRYVNYSSLLKNKVNISKQQKSFDIKQEYSIACFILQSLLKRKY